MSSYNKYPQTSRTFLKILAVPSNTDFWICDVFTGIPISFKLSFNRVGVVPNNPITTGKIFTSVFHTQGGHSAHTHTGR